MLREFINIAGADQLMPGGVAAWRHGPIVTGGAATPDKPLRVLASYLLESGLTAGSAAARTHGESQQGVNVMPSPHSQGTIEERRSARQGLPPRTLPACYTAPYSQMPQVSRSSAGTVTGKISTRRAPPAARECTRSGSPVH
jgi:hypothetical protein